MMYSMQITFLLNKSVSYQQFSLKPYISNKTMPLLSSKCPIYHTFQCCAQKIMTSKFTSSKGLNKIHQQFMGTFTALHLFFLLPPHSHSSHNSCMLANPCATSSLSTDEQKLNQQPPQHLAIFSPHARHHANAVWRIIYKFDVQRDELPCISEAQFSADNEMSVPCTTMEAFSILKNSVKMVFHLCSISHVENNVVTMTFQTAPERTNNRNNNAKSHDFNCQNEEETTRVMLNYITLTPTEHSSQVAIFPSSPTAQPSFTLGCMGQHFVSYQYLPAEAIYYCCTFQKISHHFHFLCLGNDHFRNTVGQDKEFKIKVAGK